MKKNKQKYSELCIIKLLFYLLKSSGLETSIVMNASFKFSEIKKNTQKYQEITKNSLKIPKYMHATSLSVMQIHKLSRKL